MYDLHAWGRAPSPVRSHNNHRSIGGDPIPPSSPLRPLPSANVWSVVNVGVSLFESNSKYISGRYLKWQPRGFIGDILRQALQLYHQQMVDARCFWEVFCWSEKRGWRDGSSWECHRGKKFLYVRVCVWFVILVYHYCISLSFFWGGGFRE